MLCMTVEYLQLNCTTDLYHYDSQKLQPTNAELMARKFVISLAARVLIEID